MSQSSRPFDVDPYTGIHRTFIYDDDTDTFTIQTAVDVKPRLEVNKIETNLYDERTPWKGDVHHVASIPLSIYFELKEKGIIDDDKAFKKWLNDPDNRAFRTRPGKV